MNRANIASLFRVKICGITHPDDARMAAEAGADAIGLNFFVGSRRCVTIDQADQIVAALPSHVKKVGVFVNAPVSEIVEIGDRLALDAIQLHGDESPEQILQLAPRAVIKALRPNVAGNLMLVGYVMKCVECGAKPRMILIDSAAQGEYGGTGRLSDWDIAIEFRRSHRMPPLVLAGGLTPDNIREAIATVQPAAVDTASGVESAPGYKDPDKTRRFVAAALDAFAALDSAIPAPERPT
ncbi:MAG TPA: phosphoribosylanthranilate isomerase [Pirellulales bacterium]|nr:phosphoribosylanthranilate isomerase [Pirellulales bacterium]